MPMVVDEPSPHMTTPEDGFLTVGDLRWMIETLDNDVPVLVQVVGLSQCVPVVGITNPMTDVLPEPGCTYAELVESSLVIEC